MATVVDDDEENFAEDEVTIEFGEEEPVSLYGGHPASGAAGGARFVEYPGEDFSQYLTESPGLPPADYDETPPDPVRRRYVKNAKGTTGRNSRFQRSSTSPGDLSTTPSQNAVDNTRLVPDDDVDQIATPTSGYSGYEAIMPAPPSPPSVPRKARDTIRDRLGRFFSAGQSSRLASKQEPERPAIQNFTFADSKIGMMMLAQREEEEAAAAASQDDLPDTQSDLGPGQQTWWDVGTLSSNRSLRIREKFDRRRQERSNSTSDLTAEKSEDRRGSLFGTISKAVGRVRARRSSDAAFAKLPKSASTASLPTQGLPDEEETAGSDAPFQLRPRGYPQNQTQGHGTKSKTNEDQSQVRGSKLKNSEDRTRDQNSSDRLEGNDDHYHDRGLWPKGNTNQHQGQGQPQSTEPKGDEGQSQGRLYAKRRTRLKNGVATRAGDPTAPTEKQSETPKNQAQPGSGLRFTDIYEEINRMTTDLHTHENTFL